MCNSFCQRGALTVMAVAISACSAVRTPPPEGPSQRILVYTASDWMTVPEVAAHAQRLSGVPVHEAVEVGPMRYRLTLLCADHDACRAARPCSAASSWCRRSSSARSSSWRPGRSVATRR